MKILIMMGTAALNPNKRVKKGNPKKPVLGKLAINAPTGFYRGRKVLKSKADVA